MGIMTSCKAANARHRRPHRFSAFSQDSNRLIHYLAFPTLSGFLHTLGFDPENTVRRAGLCVRKQAGEVVLEALITDDNDLIHFRQLVGQSWDGISLIFAQVLQTAVDAEIDFFSTWSPSLLRTSTNCDTAYSGVYSGHVKNRAAVAETKEFLLNTIHLCWTSRAPFSMSPSTSGFIDVRIPPVLYQEEDDL